MILQFYISVVIDGTLYVENQHDVKTSENRTRFY